MLIEEYERERGSIIVEGNEVAVSVPTDDGLRYLRTYPEGPTYAAVTGYYSLIYGTRGLERAEDDVLSGDDPGCSSAGSPTCSPGATPRAATSSSPWTRPCSRPPWPASAT